MAKEYEVILGNIFNLGSPDVLIHASMGKVVVMVKIAWPSLLIGSFVTSIHYSVLSFITNCRMFVSFVSFMTAESFIPSNNTCDLFFSNLEFHFKIVA